VAGEITPGQLVAFYGYTAFLTMPLRTATEFVDKVTRARVGARRVVTILAVEPDHLRAAGSASRSGGDALDPLAPLVGVAPVVDPASGVVVEPGQLTALVAARPEETSAIAHRLGRTAPGRHGIRWGDVELDDLPVEAVRAHVVVSEADPHLFSGPVREALGGSSDEERYAAVWVASASDALDGLDGGMDGVLEERGRALSGGQRQRVALARALLRDPDVLVLVEPTSAVDAHTEARIAERLAASRAGRTTVVVTASPLVLDRADTVLLVQDGVVTARGRHHDLMRSVPTYRDVVLRGEE
jgi:ABC-type multidrug transport system fused ATPase/permease subunit